MRWRTWAIGPALAVVAGCIVVPSAPGPDRDPADAPESILAGLVEAHNRARSEAGLPALRVEGRLVASARGHARFMAERQRMTHRGRGGSSPFRRMEEQGYTFRRAGENVAAGRFTRDSLMRAWMRSPGHRRNILGPFSQVGAAYATDERGTTYWCVTFGEPEGR